MSKAVDYLLSLERFGMKPTLNYVRTLLGQLGNPHLNYRVIHVAGSVGKGSVCAYIAEGLRAAGYRVGLNIKPHIERFNERISVDGIPISDYEMDEMINQIIPKVRQITNEQGSPTQFDVSTALAFWHYARSNVNIAVIETGMGGVWDSTNIVDPLISVITPITYDHTEILGDTLGEIALQKAGIIKPNRPVVIGPQSNEAWEVLSKDAAGKGAPIVNVVPSDMATVPTVGGEFRFRQGKDGEKRLVLFKEDDGPKVFEVGMLGVHQVENAAIAASVLYTLAEMGYALDEKAIASSLAYTQLPGRLEVVGIDPIVLLDGAHNEKAARSLADTLKEQYPDTLVTMVMGVSIDKSAKALLECLLPIVNRVIFTKATHSRLGGYEPEALESIAKGLFDKEILTAQTPDEALGLARRLTDSDGVICVCGSLYLVGEIRRIILKQ